MAGSGTGGGNSDFLNSSSTEGTLKPPILVVADLENPRKIHKILQP